MQMVICDHVEWWAMPPYSQGVRMISNKDREIILSIVRKYRVPKVLLFGSSLTESAGARDIDLAIEGIADTDYFAFYGELMCALSKSVDIIDLSKESKFVDMVKQEGIRLDA
jgi:predicted nucleotidyltransferase